MPCDYKAPNGQPSKLFDQLHQHYSKFYPAAEAEKLSAAGWLFPKTANFQQLVKEPLLDENGEPQPVFYAVDNNVIPGFRDSVDGTFLKLSDYFNKEEGRDVVNVAIDPKTEPNRLGQLQALGLNVNVARTQDGMLYVSGTSEKDNVYFNDDVLEATEAVPVAEHFVNGENVSSVLKRIIKDPADDANVTIAAQIAVGSKKQPTIKLLSREQIDEAYPDYKDKKVINMFYDPALHAIVVNDDIQINAKQFEAVILEEIIHANTAREINSNNDTAAQWFRQYESVKAAMDKAGKKSKYLINSTEFLYGVLRDKGFRSTLNDLTLPEGNMTFLQETIRWIMGLFGIRPSQTDAVMGMLDMANTVLKSSLAAPPASYMADLAEAEPAANADQTLAAEEEVNRTGATVSVEGKTEKDNFSGNPLFDKYILALLEKQQSLKLSKQQKSKAVRTGISNQQSIYGKDLKELQTELNYVALIRIGSSQVALMESQFDQVDSLSEINENLKLLKEWGELAVEMDVNLKENELELDKEMSEFVSGISDKATRLYSKYYSKMFEVYRAGLTAEFVNPAVVNEITRDMTIKDIGSLASNFIGLSYGQNAIERAVNTLILRSADENNEEYLAFASEYAERLKKIGGKENMDFLFKTNAKGKKELVSRYNNKLYDQMEKLRGEIIGFDNDRRPQEYELRHLTKQFNLAKNAGNVDLMNELSDKIRGIRAALDGHRASSKTWDNYYEFMREHMEWDIEQNDQRDQEWEAFQEDLRTQFVDRLGGEGMFNEGWYQAELSKHDPQRFINWIKTGKDRPANASKWFKASPKAEWANTEYFNSLTADQKEFYDWFTDRLVKANENIPQNELNFGEYEADKLIKQFAFFDERGLSKMKYLLNDIRDSAVKGFTVSYAEGEDSYKLNAPISGRPVDSVRFTKVSEVINKTEGFVSEKQGMNDDIRKKIEEGVYKLNENGYVVKTSNGKMIKNIVQQTADPKQIFEDFVKMSIAYKYKKSVEDLLNTSKEIAYAAKILQTTSDGRAMKKFGQAFSAKGNNLVESRISFTADAYLYNKSKEAFTKDGGVPGESEFSIEQTIETLNHFTKARQLGMNFASGLTNLAMGTIGNWMYAGRGEFFDETELSKAYWTLKDTVGKLLTGNIAEVGNAKKIMLLIQRTNLFGGFQEDMMMDDSVMSNLFNKLFVFQKSGEYMNQGAVMIATMMREKLKNADGTAYMVNGKEVSLWDAFEVDGTKLQLKYKDSNYGDPEVLRNFVFAIRQINKEIHGDYDPLNPMQIKRKLAGRLLMTFKTWLPMAIKSRTGYRMRDEILSNFANRDIWREGRWRTFSRTMFQQGFAKGSANLFKFSVAVMASTIGVIPGLDRGLNKRLLEGMGVSAEDRANMMVNIKEAWWLMMLSAVGLVLKNLKDDDDDKDKAVDTSDDAEVKFLTYLLNQTQRIDNDMWFYYSPNSVQKIVKDPIAIGSTLKQMVEVGYAAYTYVMDHESDTYMKGRREGNSKLMTQLRLMFPISKQAENVWGMWSEVYSNNRR